MTLPIARLANLGGPRGVTFREQPDGFTTRLDLDIREPLGHACLAAFDPLPRSRRWLSDTRHSFLVEAHLPEAWTTLIDTAEDVCPDCAPAGLPRHPAEQRRHHCLALLEARSALRFGALHAHGLGPCSCRVAVPPESVEDRLFAQAIREACPAQVRPVGPGIWHVRLPLSLLHAELDWARLAAEDPEGAADLLEMAGHLATLADCLEGEAEHVATRDHGAEAVAAECDLYTLSRSWAIRGSRRLRRARLRPGRLERAAAAVAGLAALERQRRTRVAATA